MQIDVEVDEAETTPYMQDFRLALGISMQLVNRDELHMISLFFFFFVKNLNNIKENKVILTEVTWRVMCKVSIKLGAMSLLQACAQAKVRQLDVALGFSSIQ